MVRDAGAMLIARVLVAVCWLESLTCKESVKLPAASGVPDRVSVSAAKPSPWGTEPARLQRNGGVPPVAIAWIFWLYGAATIPDGSVEPTAIVRTGGITTREKFFVAETPALSLTPTVKLNVPRV